jgi:hypothetical protein
VLATGQRFGATGIDAGDPDEARLAANSPHSASWQEIRIAGNPDRCRGLTKISRGVRIVTAAGHDNGVLIVISTAAAASQ